jgi:hypothetical protein
MAITMTQKLLTSLWTEEVATVEAAVGHFEADGAMKNDCRVAFFEIVRDDHLHVNITHRYPTRTARGWAGPASLPQGFVHNRTFGDTPARQIIRHVREMVFASPLR